MWYEITPQINEVSRVSKSVFPLVSLLTRRLLLLYCIWLQQRRLTLGSVSNLGYSTENQFLPSKNMFAPVCNEKGNLRELVIFETGMFHVIKICYWISLFGPHWRKEKGTSGSKQRLFQFFSVVGLLNGKQQIDWWVLFIDVFTSSGIAFQFLFPLRLTNKLSYGLFTCMVTALYSCSSAGGITVQLNVVICDERMID